jgi:hypothetical protein
MEEWGERALVVKDPVVLSQPVRRLRGGSDPLLVKASDGCTYVVKFRENPQGAQVLFNEAAGTALYRSLGLPVARWKALRVTQKFIDQYPAWWSAADGDTSTPRPGLCFASLYLGDQESQVFEILPSARLKRVEGRELFWLAWLVDVCAQHSDNRQVLFVEQRQRTLKPFFIDHGHMFSGSESGKHPHFCASRYLDSRIYPPVTKDWSSCIGSLLHSKLETLWQEIRAIPNDWKCESYLRAFAVCLQTMSSPGALNANFELLRGICQKMYGRESDDSRSRCSGAGAVLCSGVQVA